MQHEDAEWLDWRHRKHAELERQHAARSAALAARHQARARSGPESLRSLHGRLGALYHRMEERHLASAELHALGAARLERSAGRSLGALRPAFLAAVASLLGASSALAVLNGQRHGTAVVGASDRTARAAHELELVMAEGPTLDATRSGTLITAAGTALADRWPRYGAAVAELGVHAVVAAPLGLPGTRIGALCALGREPEMGSAATVDAGQVADVFTRLLLRLADDDPLVLSLFDDTGDLAVVHQAEGMVSVHCECSIRDAQDLLAMRAFAEGMPVADVAAQVVTGQTRFA